MDPKKQQYLNKVIELYLNLPETPLRCGRSDIELACRWYQEEISLSDLDAALLLATARRLSRPQSYSPIRSLHYFQPIVDEVRREPLSVDYLQYLRNAIERMKKN